MNGHPAPAASQREMEDRCVRYADLVPCQIAFIDRRTPGCEGNENFAIIGAGVAEASGQHVHVTIPHGFNVGGARQLPGTSNSQHSHEREEIFFVHEGRFRFHFGPERDDGFLDLAEGDTISVPVRVFRGFENIGDRPGYLFAVLGGDDPGPVTWAPYVLRNARGTGLVLLDDGRLIDTTRGETVPADGTITQPLEEEALRAFRRIGPQEAERFIVRNAGLQPEPGSPLSREGVEEFPVLGPASPAENIRAAPVNEPSGLHLRRLRLNAGAEIPVHAREEEEVLFVYRGRLKITWAAGTLSLHRGDHLTLPKGLQRRWSNPDQVPADIVVVRGGNAPAAPIPGD